MRSGAAAGSRPRPVESVPSGSESKQGHGAELPQRWNQSMLCSATARLSESQRFAVRPCQTRGRLRKGDPPRGPLRSDDVCGVRVPDRGGRVGLRSSFDGGDGRVAGSRNGLRPSSADCSRRGRDRSACRSRTRSDSEGISPVSASPAAHPRPALCPNEATADNVPESRKTCDNPGRSSFCLR